MGCGGFPRGAVATPLTGGRRPDNQGGEAMPAASGLPADRDPALRVTPLPADVNIHGDVFGGWIMSMADIAGAIVAERCARGRVVTVAVNEFVFRQPVAIGDLVSFYGEVARIGTTSITVAVEVFAQRRPEDVEIVKVTEARITYVAIDRQGRPRAVEADS